MKNKGLLLLFFFGAEQRPSEVKRRYSQLLEDSPEIKLISKYESDFVFYKNEKDGWASLSETIFKNYENYSGFIVYTQPENALLAANVMSFIFQGLVKPIIFTGPSVKSNLINAFEVAKSGLPEVALLFGNRVVRPTRAFFSPKNALNVFDCHADGLIGRIDFGFSPAKSAKAIQKKSTAKTTKLNYAPTLNGKVHCVNFFPFTDLTLLETMGGDGLVIRGGQFTPEAIKSIHALKRNVVLFQTESQHQCPSCLNVKDATIHAVLAKLIWGLGQTRDRTKVRRLLSLNLAGEWGARDA